MRTIRIPSSVSNSKNKNDAIIERGATSIDIGIHEYHGPRDELNIKAQVSKLVYRDTSWYAFGIDANTSRSEDVVPF